MKFGFAPLLFFFVFSISLVIPAQAVQVGPPADFRGLAWNTELKDIPGMAPVPARDCRDTYFREGEKLVFNGAGIESVAYYFSDNRLYGVGVAFKGDSNLFLIKDSLIQMYGPGRQAGTKYGWIWKGFSLVVDYDRDTGRGSITYRYEPPVSKTWKRPEMPDEEDME